VGHAMLGCMVGLGGAPNGNTGVTPFATGRALQPRTIGWGMRKGPTYRQGALPQQLPSRSWTSPRCGHVWQRVTVHPAGLSTQENTPVALAS
jgi:hypothetical protein